jgi:putative transposase
LVWLLKKVFKIIHSIKGLSSLDVGQHERFARVARLKGANNLTDLCQTFAVHRSSYNYWATRKSIIKPERVKQLAEVKRIHNLSNSSAGARTVATMATTEGFPMSSYVVIKRMKELALVSCQLPPSSLQENWQRAPGNSEHAESGIHCRLP